jgi:hypothetical protein
MLPRACEVEIGHVVKAFPKINVVVIELTLPISIGDILQFRYVRYAF